MQKQAGPLPSLRHVEQNTGEVTLLILHSSKPGNLCFAISSFLVCLNQQSLACHFVCDIHIYWPPAKHPVCVCVCICACVCVNPVLLAGGGHPGWRQCHRAGGLSSPPAGFTLRPVLPVQALPRQKEEEEEERAHTDRHTARTQSHQVIKRLLLLLTTVWEWIHCQFRN